MAHLIFLKFTYFDL